MHRFLFALLILLVILTCKKEQKQQPVKPDSSTVQIENAPSWFKTYPQQEGFLYAAGQATSSRPEIARRKAMLNARLKLAEKLKQQGDSLNTLLRWSRVKEEKQIRQGKRWQSFVLLELPLENNSR